MEVGCPEEKPNSPSRTRLTASWLYSCSSQICGERSSNQIHNASRTTAPASKIQSKIDPFLAEVCSCMLSLELPQRRHRRGTDVEPVVQNRNIGEHQHEKRNDAEDQ